MLRTTLGNTKVECLGLLAFPRGHSGPCTLSGGVRDRGQGGTGGTAVALGEAAFPEAL